MPSEIKSIACIPITIIDKYDEIVKGVLSIDCNQIDKINFFEKINEISIDTLIPYVKLLSLIYGIENLKNI